MHIVENGDTIRVLVSGTRGTYSVVGEFLEREPDSIRFLDTGNRTHNVPLSNILTVSVIDKKSSRTLHARADFPPAQEDLLISLDGFFASAEIEDLPGEANCAAAVFESVLAQSKDDTLTTIASDSLKFLGRLVDRLQSETFQESEGIRESLLLMAEDLSNDVQAASASVRSARVLTSFLQRVQEAESEDWKEFSRQHQPLPRIVTAEEPTLSVAGNNEFELPVRVTLDDLYPPAEAVSVVVDEPQGVRILSRPADIPVLRPGETRTVSFRLSTDVRLVDKKTFTLRARIMYRGLGNERLISPRQYLRIKLRRERAFLPIANPYRRYSGGGKIEDPNMFFGRKELTGELTEQLASKSHGTCIAIFGQQRTGKSSLVTQVERRLQSRGIFVAHVSMGLVDRGDLMSSFVAAVLDRFRVQVGQHIDGTRLLNSWPTERAVQDRPLRSIQTALAASRAHLSTPSGGSPRFVIIADEFTYLYEVLRRSHIEIKDVDALRDFMRQWKGLIEDKVVSTLLVGQDTMPSFFNAFPNEFSMMHTLRLDYLTAEETNALANEPTMIGSESRFTQYALGAIAYYTSGHPYFAQILCDRVVTLANSNRHDPVSDIDVENAVESLVDGPNQIDRHRFACLLSADSTGTIVGGPSGEPLVGEESTDLALGILQDLAKWEGNQRLWVESSRLNLDEGMRFAVWSDLATRKVIEVRDDYCQVRIPLFSEYLRRIGD